MIKIKNIVDEEVGYVFPGKISKIVCHVTTTRQMFETINGLIEEVEILKKRVTDIEEKYGTSKVDQVQSVKIQNIEEKFLELLKEKYNETITSRSNQECNQD